MSRDVLDQQISRLITGWGDEEASQKILLAIESRAEERFWDRVKLWSSQADEGDEPLEWASVGVGNLGEIEEDGERYTMVYVKDFIDLPAYNLLRQYSISLLLRDIRKILRNKFACLFVHSHPNQSLEFSPEDKALALIVDQMAGRPLLHVVVNPKGGKNILHFIPCWDCVHGPFRKGQEVRKENGNNTY